MNSKGRMTLRNMPNRKVGMSHPDYMEAWDAGDFDLILKKQVRQVKWLYNNSNKCLMVYEEKMVRGIVQRLQSRIKELEKK